MKPFTISEGECVAHTLAKQLMARNEPTPDFDTRFPNKLEGCLVALFQRFNKKDLYTGFLKKVSMLFYLMVKNHPFQNSNKRIAVTTLLYFLHKNKKWLKVDNQELYNFAKWVAESNAKLKNETVQAIEKFVKTYMVKVQEEQRSIFLSR